MAEKIRGNLPVFEESGHDYTGEWGRLLSGTENDFPFEATVVNEEVPFPHVIGGKMREYFDCTDPNSYRLIPPGLYLEAYLKARKAGLV